MSSPLSGFTAVPNPQMLAFMPIQSYLMMYFAGSAWQFGKRKISAKSNEEFNNLTMKTLLEEHTMELKSVIPTLERSLNDITPLIRILIEQYGDFIKEAIKATPVAIQNVIGTTAFQANNLASIEAWLKNVFPSLPATAYAEMAKDIQTNQVGDFSLEAFPDKPKQKITTPVGINPITGVAFNPHLPDPLKTQAEQIIKGQEGLKISQKVQRILLTATQTRLFTRYKSFTEARNAVIKQIASWKAQGKSPSTFMLTSLRNFDIQLAKSRQQINQTKTVNLKGFEVYFKWLATQ